jgi:hypothetical protein
MLLINALWQSLAKWPGFLQLKQGPLGQGWRGSSCGYVVTAFVYWVDITFVYTLLLWYCR